MGILQVEDEKNWTTLSSNTKYRLCIETEQFENCKENEKKESRGFV